MLISTTWKTLTAAKAGSSSNIEWAVEARLLSQNKFDNSSSYELRLTAKALSGSGSSSGVIVSGDINRDLGYVSINSSVKVWAVQQLTIKHNSEGDATKKVDVKVTAHGFSPLSTGVMTGVLEFPQIPRESTITSQFGDYIDGKSKAIILVTKKYSGFTTTVLVKYGSKTLTLGTKSSATDFSFQVPLEWIKEFPHKESEKAYVYADTYSGDTKIGSTTSDFFTVFNPPTRTVQSTGAPVGEKFNLSVIRSPRFDFLTDRIYVKEEGSTEEIMDWDNPSSTDLSFQIPLEWAEKFPNALSHRWYVYIDTYYDGVKIGHTQSDYGTVTVPESAKADGINPNVIELNEKVLAKGHGITLIGQSKKRLSIKAIAKLGASIRSVNVKQNGSNIATLSKTVGDIYEGETRSILNGSYLFSITDSRGLMTEVSVEEVSYVYANIKPELSISRKVPTANSGTLKATGTIFNQLNNQLNIEVRAYRDNATEEDNAVIKKPPKFIYDPSSVDFSFEMELENTLYENNYTFIVAFKDDFMEVSQRIDFPSSIPVMWLGKRTVQINDYLMVKKGCSAGGKRLLNADSFIIQSFESSDGGPIDKATGIRQNFDILAPTGYVLLAPLFAQATKHRDIACTIEKVSGNKVSVIAHNYNDNWVCPDSYVRLYCLFVKI